MNRLFLLVIILINSILSYAQTVFVQNGKPVSDSLFNERLFYLKDFTRSKVTLNDGTSYIINANVMTLDQVVLMIENGDTLRVQREKDITHFSGGGFLIDKINGVYYQLLNTDGETSLAISKTMIIEGEKLTGAYGTSNETASMNRISHLSSNSESVLSSHGSLAWRDRNDVREVNYSYKEHLFLISKDRKYIPTKKNFERLFPKRKSDMAKYIGENSISFSDDSNIIALFNYLMSSE